MINKNAYAELKIKANTDFYNKAHDFIRMEVTEIQNAHKSYEDCFINFIGWIKDNSSHSEKDLQETLERFYGCKKTYQEGLKNLNKMGVNLSQLPKELNYMEILN